MVDIFTVCGFLSSAAFSCLAWIGWIVLAIVLIACSHYFIVLQSRDKKLIKCVPAAADWYIFGHLLHLSRVPAVFYRQLLGLADKYRQVGMYRLCCYTMDSAVLISPDYVEKLCKSNVLLDKSYQYHILESWLGISLLTSTGQIWKQKRRLLTPSFHFNIVKGFLPVITEQVDVLITQIRSQAEKGDVINISPYITLASLDIIAETAMGVKLSAQTDGESRYTSEIMLLKQAFYWRLNSLWLWRDFVFFNTPTGRRVITALKYVHGYADEVIQSRKEGHSRPANEQHQAFLDALLLARDENGDPLDDTVIRMEVDTFMFEGHDTVSSAIEHTIFILGHHPEEQAECQKEIDGIFGSSSRDITWEDLSKLTYLEWCIKEAMRLYPPVPLVGRSLSEDTEFGDYIIPKGTNTFIFVAGIHRDPKYYPEPHKFDPLRFTPEASASRHPFAYVPFSAGARNCIGQRLAMIELKVMLATLLRHYNITSMQSIGDLADNPGIVLHVQDGVKVMLTARHPHA